MARLAVVLAFAIVLPACGGNVLADPSGDRADATTDAPLPDAPLPDAPLPEDAAPDGGLPPTDTGVDASPPPDAAVPDSGGAALGDLFPEVTEIVVVVNLSDGFMEPYANDLYTIDFATGQASFNEGSPVDVEAGDLEEIAALVRATPYRTIDPCISLAVDGAPYPPSLVVSSASTSKEFGASDQECAESDHDVWGDVVSCADFQAVHAAVLEVLGMVQPPAECISYSW